MAVLVDDAHWLDGSSAQALLFAFRRLVADPVAVVLAVRAGRAVAARRRRPAHPPARGPGPGGRRPSCSGASGMHRSARSWPTVSTVATGGNPLALLELAAERAAPGRPTARRAARRQDQRRRACSCSALRTLPQRTRDALVLAAASDGGELPVLARAAAELGLDLADLVRPRRQA